MTACSYYHQSTTGNKIYYTFTTKVETAWTGKPDSVFNTNCMLMLVTFSLKDKRFHNAEISLQACFSGVPRQQLSLKASEVFRTNDIEICKFNIARNRFFLVRLLSPSVDGHSRCTRMFEDRYYSAFYSVDKVYIKHLKGR